MGKIEYAFLCTVVAFLVVKITEISIFGIFRHFRNAAVIKMTQHCDTVYYALVTTYRLHIAKPKFERKKIKCICIGQNQIGFFYVQ